MKILRTTLCILALCTYAGCTANQPSASTLSYIANSQQTGEIFQTQQAGDPASAAGRPQQLPTQQLTVSTPDGDVAFSVQVARDEQTRAEGLMYRQDMPMNEGMIFLFDKEQPLTFWMKNTLIPLDMIYMDKDWKVVSIQKQAQPCTADPCVLYPSMQDAQYVLEINGGLSDKLGIRQGSMIQFQP